MIDPQTQQQLREAKKTMRRLEKQVPIAMSAALNRTSQGLRTEAVRKIRETYDIKASDVRPTIRLTRATPGNLRLSVSSRGRNIPLIRFKVNPKSPPSRQPRVLKASVKKSGLKPIRGAFTTRVGGHIGVLTRLGKKRLPIKELYGPSVPVMLGGTQVKDHLITEGERRIEQRFKHEIERRLGGSS